MRNLDYASSPEDVRRHFEDCGKIKDVYLPLEYETRKPKGFGFVEYESQDDAYYAVRKMNNTILGDKEISVTIAQNRRKSPRTMQRYDQYSSIFILTSEYCFKTSFSKSFSTELS